ncbi:YaaC family protein [Citricoccus sp. CH26A]|uniref:YaaC family protein n=1 Tax=Citricoccus TaxID=169133 RepID=UPI001145ABDB|nr:YaaC family protein [Citricoccus sp. CH26A]
MNDARRRLFNSSLEQAQQQFEAARLVGFESRALNLYYGLSQAGRAISAAMTPAGTNQSPDVSGHGLKVLDLPGTKPQKLFDMQVKGSGSDNTSYRRLASLLDSDHLSAPVSLGSIWHMLPDLYLDRPIGSYAEPRWPERPYTQENEKTFKLQATAAEMQDGEVELRRQYPDLAAARLVKYGGGPHNVNADGARTDEAVFSYDGRNPARAYLSTHLLMPVATAGDGAKALEPVLAWWILLYSLSMITRYQPVAWTEMIDVNRSKVAVPIEAALTKALDTVPALIHATLTGS